MNTYKLFFSNQSVEITNAEKILFPPAITKKQLIDYYAAVAATMLPYLKDRPLMLQRFPDGITNTGFYQKDASDYFPSWIKRAQVPKEGGFNQYVIGQNKATLIYLANQACITKHIWLSKIDKLSYPDRMIFDIDPANTSQFSLVKKTALALKHLLEHLELKSFVMTTGSRGMHVVVPLIRKHEFKEVKEFADACAQLLVKQQPQELTVEFSKKKREQRIFIDTLRNQYGATSVAPYSVRAQPNAPVATPLFWDELNNPALRAQTYTIESMQERLEILKDPWNGLKNQAQSLTKAQRILGNLQKS